MIDSSLPSVVCRRDHVLFTLGSQTLSTTVQLCRDSFVG